MSNFLPVKCLVNKSRRLTTSSFKGNCVRLRLVTILNVVHSNVFINLFLSLFMYYMQYNFYTHTHNIICRGESAIATLRIRIFTKVFEANAKLGQLCNKHAQSRCRTIVLRFTYSFLYVVYFVYSVYFSSYDMCYNTTHRAEHHIVSSS